jgi:hypothetical protein
MNWYAPLLLGCLTCAIAVASPTPTAPFRYAPRVPAGFDAAKPTPPEGPWQIGKTGSYMPAPGHIGLYATPSFSVKVVVSRRVLTPAQPQPRELQAWGLAVLDQPSWAFFGMEPWDSIRKVEAHEVVVTDAPAGRAARGARRFMTNRGAIDVYQLAAERDGSLFEVSVLVTGVRPVAAVRAWLAAFLDEPFGLAASPGLVFDAAPALTPEPRVRNNE